MKSKLIIKIICRLKYYGRDLINIYKFGIKAPRSAQLIFVKPIEITKCIKGGIFGRMDTGRVRDGDWDLKYYPLEENKKFSICKMHFENGKSWEEAGAYKHILELIRSSKNKMVDNCKTIDDIYRRYDRLDEFYNRLKENRRFNTRKELKGRIHFRENIGVYIHIDRYGNPLFGGGGVHRLYLAKFLNIKSIPAQVGVVHYDAYVNGHYSKYLKASE